jgi:glycosyltransferase involved in cell wall biosynthesis
MRIAIFDYFVMQTNAIGNCDRHILEGLCDEHEFTVFAVEFDNPRPDKIKYVRVPALKRPLFALFLTYHLLAPLIFLIYKLRHRAKFDIVQGIESNSLGVSLVYAHFCHRAYLKKHWQASRPSGLKRVARWLDHYLHSLLEPFVFRGAKKIVVPSNGLHRELAEIYGQKIGKKVQVISNPVDVERFRRPENFDPSEIRQKLGFTAPDDLILIFIALGHFERKGLPILLEAMKQVGDERVKLALIGGTPTAIKAYEDKTRSLNIDKQVNFVGFQSDVRPFLWAADLFSFPSAYEIFSLVTLEAAAARLPLLSTNVYGIEEFLVDNVNGWYIERTAPAIAEKIKYCLDNRHAVEQAGIQAASSIQKYNSQQFVDRWRSFYEAWEQPVSEAAS